MSIKKNQFLKTNHERQRNKQNFRSKTVPNYKFEIDLDLPK